MEADDETLWKNRKKLTDPDRHYKRISTEIMAAYNGLPNRLSKAAIGLFSLFIRSKIHGPKGIALKGNNEDKRIYTDVPITSDTLLREIDPIKYADGKDSVKNQQYMGKMLRWLHDNNIFYCWTYKRVHHIFIVEREVGCWKIYNPIGCVTPDSMLKIIGGYVYMMDCMVSYCVGARPIDREDIENSFGCFLNEMIGKMNSTVASSLPRWRSSCKLSKYVQDLALVLKTKALWEGLKEHPSFYKRLSPALANRLKSDVPVEEGDNMVSKMEKEIVPMKATVGKQHKPHEKRLVEEKADRPTSPLQDFSEMKGPFTDSKQFAQYYRRTIKSLKGDRIILNPFDKDATEAGAVMDRLIEAKKNNVSFLDAWIKYFAEEKLKGTKGKSRNFSSVKHFGETFQEYNGIFYVSQA